MRPTDAIRRCKYPVRGKPGGVCGEPLSGRGRFKWCPSHQQAVRQEQLKRINRFHQRAWREKHLQLFMDRRTVYRTVRKVERRLLDLFPHTRRKWLHLALLSGYKQTFGTEERNDHLWAKAVVPGSWEAMILLEHKSDQLMPIFHRPWEIHFAKRLPSLPKVSPKEPPFCVLPAEHAELGPAVLWGLRLLLDSAVESGWDGRSYGIFVLMPEVGRALGMPFGGLLHCRTMQGHSWWRLVHVGKEIDVEGKT